MSVPRPGKNKVLAYVLWFFLGFLGAHRFYVGHVAKGLYFAAATLFATALSVVNLPGTRIAGLIIGGIIFVMWIIDAIKLGKFVEAAGEAPGKTNE